MKADHNSTLKGKQISVLLVGSTPKERKANLRDFLEEHNVSPYDPGQWSGGLLVAVCGDCDDKRSYRTLDDVPFDRNILCKCGKTYLIAIQPEPEDAEPTKNLWDHLK
jgi:hypothetical protein